MTTTPTTQASTPPRPSEPRWRTAEAADGDEESQEPQLGRRTRRVWSQEVLVRAAVLQARLEAMRLDRDLSAGETKLAERVEDRLKHAALAATRVQPTRSVRNWWRGAHVDAAYQNLHAAEILMTSLYDDVHAEAEVPEAIARVEARLDRDDPRRAAAFALQAEAQSPEQRRAQLAKAVQVGFEAADSEYKRLRSFRNAVLGSAAVLGVTLIAVVAYAWNNPDALPICFSEAQQVCASGRDVPSKADVGIVASLGALGGLLSAIISIRNMQGTSVAYDVPTALAALKLPVGALTAVGGLLLVAAHFIPGLSNLDNQQQILAYAFLFGVAQQLFVGFVDKQAQELLSHAPGKAATASRPERGTFPGAPAPR